MNHTQMCVKNVQCDSGTDNSSPYLVHGLASLEQFLHINVPVQISKERDVSIILNNTYINTVAAPKSTSLEAMCSVFSYMRDIMHARSLVINRATL
jgi:hypothetical protein